MQFISVNISADNIEITHSLQINCFRKMKRQQAQVKLNLHKKQKRQCHENPRMSKLSANLKSSPRQQEVKKVSAIRKRSRGKILNFDQDNNEVPKFCSKVSVFKELVNSGPCYICVVCNHCPHRGSEDLPNRNKFCVIYDDVLSL